MAAASWGIGDFCGGIASRLASTLTALLIGQVVGLAVTVVLLVLSDAALPPTDSLVLAATGGVLGISGLGCLYLALSRGTMGIVAPLAALVGATLPALVGFLRGDVVPPVAVLGMLVALLAVLLISLPDRRLGTPVLATFHGSRLSELTLVLLAGSGFAAFYVLLDASHAAGGGTWWPLMTIRVAGAVTVAAATLVLVALGRADRMRPGRAALGMGALAAVGDLGGNLFYMLASGVGELGIVVVLSSLYPVSTAVLARLVLHERLSGIRLAGVVLALLGVALISLGEVLGG